MSLNYMLIIISSFFQLIEFTKISSSSQSYPNSSLTHTKRKKKKKVRDGGKKLEDLCMNCHILFL